MRVSLSSKLSRSGALLACTLLAGCLGSSPESRFYVLSPMEAPQRAADPRAELSVPGIYLSAIDLPAYLLVPQIVSRSDTNSLELAEFDRWGEPLRDSFLRVVGINLGFLLPASQVTTFPWEQRGPGAYQVTIVVTRFDSQNGQVYLSARWGISSPQPESVVTLRRSDYVAHIDPGGGDGAESQTAIVRAMSGLVASLSSDIAAAIPQR